MAAQVPLPTRSKPVAEPSPPAPAAEPSADPGHHVCVFSAEGACTETPLTSEPPLPDAEPLTSEPPLTDAAPLTSEPTPAGADWDFAPSGV
ncbi:hypothetical protein [Streptomyces poonensis]|uniref:Uncharacterized protein n=1 Tax=Streptomyces poonensis TaxID=68255 RepID=A0A918PQA7_9ACTN|nr:hypothetical protein [Streptomyces poonensis]GGZ18094.1 hypothetical protein GCM10010365_42770 [Streptomyces poonensis]GLJ91057.1 hypothetical protein GCM10017589_36630 [Streptomyces poonensis]